MNVYRTHNVILTSIFTLILTLSAFAIVSSCAGAQIIPSPQYKTLFPGIEHATVEISDPLLKVNVLRINTSTKNMKFYTTGRCEKYEADKSETIRSTVPDFLKENDLSAAVNGSFYTPFNRETIVSRGPANVTGLAISNGQLVSPAENDYSFIITKDGQYDIRLFKRDTPVSDIDLAVTGFALVLKNGELTPLEDKSRHPRTVLGISKDRQTIFLVVIDGRQPGYSIGATLTDTALILKHLGADQAINLDGGGSTTMAVKDEDGNPKVLNRPVGQGPANTLRHNANALGVKVF